jgi:hypothetical protein
MYCHVKSHGMSVPPSDLEPELHPLSWFSEARLVVVQTLSSYALDDPPDPQTFYHRLNVQTDLSLSGNGARK